MYLRNSLYLSQYQPSGSFKDRGISHYALTLRDKGAKKLISSSGGNAGLACTAAGRSLGLEVQVIVPETTGEIIKSKIQSLVSSNTSIFFLEYLNINTDLSFHSLLHTQGASVRVHGANWNAADELARELVDQDPDAVDIAVYTYYSYTQCYNSTLLYRHMSPPSTTPLSGKVTLPSSTNLRRKLAHHRTSSRR